MLHRAASLAIALSAVAFPLVAAGQAAQVGYGVCASQLNLQTIYVSGVLQAPASAAASVRAGFMQFLAERYGYKGAVGCVPAANAAAAEKMLQDRANALRAAKKTVIETGWVDNTPAPAAKLAGMMKSMAGGTAQGSTATPAAAGTSSATGSAGAASSGAASGATSSGSGGASGNSGLASVLASIFGGGGSGACSGGSAAKSQSGSAGGGASAGAGSSSSGSSAGASGSSGTSGSGAGSSGGNAASGGCQSALSQVSGALSSAFAQKPDSGAASGSGHTAADGLGSAQAQNTRLVVYGCGRQDTQVACVTDLTNQNKADTLVQSADLWKDTFIVDDRGDRHPRSRGFFLNVDGDQRAQLDVSYGKSARFVLMFDDVQSKVQKVSLRSKTGGLDVEDIPLISTGNAPATGSDASH